MKRIGGGCTQSFQTLLFGISSNLSRVYSERQTQSGSVDEDRPHDHLTALAAVWGEFVAYDISYTLPLSGYEQCCDSMFRKENPMECHPITAHTAASTFCQEYVRSAIGLKPGCALGPREQGCYLDWFQ